MPNELLEITDKNSKTDGLSSRRDSAYCRARFSGEDNAIGRVRPSVRFHFHLFEPNNLWLGFFLHVKVKVKANGPQQLATSLTATGTHMPYGITKCYLPPGSGDISALTLAEAGTRFSDPGGMQVDLVGWLHTEMVYPPADCHPSQYSPGYGL